MILFIFPAIADTIGVSLNFAAYNATCLFGKKSSENTLLPAEGRLSEMIAVRFLNEQVACCQLCRKNQHTPIVG
ncbi:MULTISPECIES: hypothetical protein [Bacteroidaceae]|uniref:hypothetical protein n=1 Tax=Bacteroidaceae TaxID=815 RepID=UPI0022E225E0|nr:hypothetical protein [Phocaeicola vulgatus]